jgi:hypothetical protein
LPSNINYLKETYQDQINNNKGSNSIRTTLEKFIV